MRNRVVDFIKRKYNWNNWPLEDAVTLLLYSLSFTVGMSIVAAYIVESKLGLLFILLAQCVLLAFVMSYFGKFLIPAIAKIPDETPPKIEDEATGLNREQTDEERLMYEQLTANIIDSVRNDFDDWKLDSAGMDMYANDKLKLSIYPDTSTTYDGADYLRKATVFDETRVCRRFDGFTKSQRNRIAMAFVEQKRKKESIKDQIDRLYDKHRITRLNSIMSRKK